MSKSICSSLCHLIDWCPSSSVCPVGSLGSCCFFLAALRSLAVLLVSTVFFLNVLRQSSVPSQTQCCHTCDTSALSRHRFRYALRISILGYHQRWALCPGCPRARVAHTAQDSSRDAHLHHCDKNRKVCNWRIASVIATQGLENEPTTHREQKERHCRTQRKLADKTQNVKQLPSHSSTDDVEPQRPLERKWLEPKRSRNQVLRKSRALQCWSEDSAENVIGTTCGEVACGIDHGISELGEIATKFSNRAVVQSVFDTW